MRFVRLLPCVVAFVACGGGASVLPPSRADLAWTDVSEVAGPADAGRDSRLDSGQEPLDDGTPDAEPDGDAAGDAADFGAGDAADFGAGDVPADAADATDPQDSQVAETVWLDPGDDDPGTADPGSPPTDPGFELPELDPGGGAHSLAIRFVAANLTSGNYQSYDPGHGIRLMAGCKADVLLVQEFNYGDNRAADYRAMANAICGIGCDYAVGAGQIPNGVVSRWPIVESGWWDDPNISNRDLDWARIDLPGDKDLFAISVHLHTSPSSDQVTAAQVVARKVSEHRAANPGCCWYVVGGDFNGTAAVSNSGFGAWKGEPVFAVTGPHPRGEDGLEGTNASRSSQYDFVLLDTALRAHQVPVVFPDPGGHGGSLSYTDGLVFDSRDFTQAELDRYFPPARAGDSGASNMQHMAVVKDVVVSY